MEKKDLGGNPLQTLQLVEGIVTWAFNTIGTAIPIFGWRKHIQTDIDDMKKNIAIMAKAIQDLQDK